MVSSLHVDVGPPSSTSSSPLSPSSPTLEERRRPGTLSIWQERERLQQQREKASVDHMSSGSPSVVLHRSSSRIDVPSSPPSSGQAQKPNSFLFRASSRSNTLESRLKLTLPEDLGEALSNGTVLCQLVNHIRPRSVSIIHIPSPAVPKLSSAKCRLNVENFITACRKLGVPEDSLCSPQLIMEDEGLSRLAQTVQVLVDLADGSQRALKQEISGTAGSTQC
ncbi:hypothetical protein INR49_002690 [Caranx melampygus]|nr:hypothetical protein INR49_002690 [Caranx melampygus]